MFEFLNTDMQLVQFYLLTNFSFMLCLFVKRSQTLVLVVTIEATGDQVHGKKRKKRNQTNARVHLYCHLYSLFKTIL